MIHVVNLKKSDLSGYGEVWGIMRYLKNMPHYVKHVPALSPDRDLFLLYRTLHESKRWDSRSFQSQYVPQFLRQMHGKEAMDALNLLWRLDREGMDVAIGCTCADEDICHRSIVAGLLQGAGASVSTESGADYTHYYRQYIQMGG